MNRFVRRLSLFAWLLAGVPAGSAERPNVLWITCEDTGPQLGCYGDRFAITPNLDRLAARGMRYTRAWSCGPVCAPARTAIITGAHPYSLGAEHMRSLVPPPGDFRLFPQWLREAGYYCTNNEKEDYNVLKPGQVWDESSRRAHWRNRRPGQPFFAIFNHTVTHESQVRQRSHTPVHDPARVRVPAYHPDTPEVRRDWAQYYDKVTEMDALAGANLRELEAAGLADDTIVIFYGDHGPGLPRCKRFPYNSGLHVPLIVFVPEKWRRLAPPDYQPGGTSDRLVDFVDLAPTMLSLAGVKPPAYLQGTAFMGEHAGPARAFNFGFRGRMDERIDLVRSVTDGRHVYLRNYLPHLPHGQRVAYMFETPTTQVWKRMFDEGKLPPEQAAFWQPKPVEELYDLQTDPDEVRNLAASPEQAATLQRFRDALRDHILTTRDLGFLPEAEMHRRRGGDTPRALGLDVQRYPLERILDAAETAARREASTLSKLLAWLGDADAAIRYWAVTGLRIRGAEAVLAAREPLGKLLQDEAPAVRIAAAEALGHFGDATALEPARATLIQLGSLGTNDVFTAVQALNALEGLGAKAAPALPAVKTLPTKLPGLPDRLGEYVPRLIEHLLAHED